MPAANERFGATAAGSAALKGSAVMPPLRQAAIPLAASSDDDVERTQYRKGIAARKKHSAKDKYPKKVVSLQRV